MIPYPNYQLTDDDIAVLRAYATKHGRSWKRTLAEVDWCRASYPGMSPQQSGCLQKLRNNLGPEWLDTFKLPKEES